MKLGKLSRQWFYNFYGEEVYSYIEKRFSPIVHEYLKDIKGRILDAACGSGNPYLEGIQVDKALVFGIDLDPSVKKRNQWHKNIIIHDLHSYVSEKKFELIISAYTLEHLVFPAIVLRNFYESLLERGVVILIAPQRWHYISMIERLLPATAKNLAWRLFKGHDKMPYPAYYHLCSKRDIGFEAAHQKFSMIHFRSIEGPPIWLARIPPLFMMGALLMSVFNRLSIFEPIRSTFIAILKKE